MAENIHPQNAGEGEVETGTLGGTFGDVTGTEQQVQDYIESVIGQFANFYTDEGDVPANATARQHTFTSEQDIADYLAGGGLLFQTGPGEYVVNHLVHVVRFEEDDFVWYEVWIDEAGY